MKEEDLYKICTFECPFCGASFECEIECMEGEVNPGMHALTRCPECLRITSNEIMGVSK